MNKILGITGLVFIILIASCAKEQDSNVPNVPVNEHINLDNPGYSNLNVIGGAVMISGGLRGIIIYHSSSDEYKAYERTCTYQSENSNAIVTLDLAISTASDSSCGSRFRLTDGTVSAPPANQPLKQYQTSLSGRDLYIFN